METKIRLLERSADPTDRQRGAILRCRYDGHIEWEIRAVYHYYDCRKLGISIQIALEGGEIQFFYKDYELLLKSQHYIVGLIAVDVKKHLAKCRRCGEKNDRAKGYLEIIAEACGLL